MGSVVGSALSSMGSIAKDRLKAELASKLDRPKPYTLGSVFATTPRPSRLSILFGLRGKSARGTPAGIYMQKLVTGGQKLATPFENLLYSRFNFQGFIRPAPGVPLDRYGNLADKLYKEIIRAMNGDDTRNIGGIFIQSKTNSRPSQGIYRRVLRDGKPALDPIVIVIDRPRYRKIFSVQETMGSVLRSDWNKAVVQSINYVLKGQGVMAIRKNDDY